MAEMWQQPLSFGRSLPKILHSPRVKNKKQRNKINARRFLFTS